MKYKRLGNTRLKVSEICLGAMTFGSSFYNIGEVDLDLAKDIVKTSWEAGVNFFDTADVYYTVCPERLGTPGLSPLHRMPHPSVRQLAKALQISKARGWATFSSLQAYYNDAGRDLEYELLPLSREEGLGVLPWSPLASGFLTGKYRRDEEGPEGARRTNFDFPPIDKEEAYDVVEVMEEIADKKGATIPQIALAWLLHREGVTSVIIGAKKMSQLKDNWGRLR